jgi:hypothetical protein
MSKRLKKIHITSVTALTCVPLLYIYNKYEITWVCLKDGTVKIHSQNSYVNKCAYEREHALM